MRFLTAEDMFALIRQGETDARYLQEPNESYDAWLQRTTLLAIEGLDDGSNPVLSAEEWTRLKGMFRDNCLQARHSNSALSSGTD